MTKTIIKIEELEDLGPVPYKSLSITLSTGHTYYIRVPLGDVVVYESKSLIDTEIEANAKTGHNSKPYYQIAREIFESTIVAPGQTLGQFLNPDSFTLNGVSYNHVLFSYEVVSDTQKYRVNVYFNKTTNFFEALGPIFQPINATLLKTVAKRILYELNIEARQNELIARVIAEKEKANEKHGIMPRDKSKEYWLTAIVEEVGEVARAIQDEGDTEYKAELIQVAALAINAILDLG